MATFCAKAGAAAIIAGMTFLASAAYACDERFPWTCKPVPSTASSEPAETSKASSKPLQINARRRGATAKPAKAASERSAQVSRKRVARKAASRRWVTRARHAKVVAAIRATEEETASSDAPSKTSADVADTARKDAADTARKDAVRRSSRPTRVADGSNESSSEFASVWKDRTVVATEVAELAAPSQPVAAPSAPVQAPLRVASQQDVNEMDLAAVDAAAANDSFWVRGLFLALGGLLAVGSALRFLV